MDQDGKQLFLQDHLTLGDYHFLVAAEKPAKIRFILEPEPSPVGAPPPAPPLPYDADPIAGPVTSAVGSLEGSSGDPAMAPPGPSAEAIDASSGADAGVPDVETLKADPDQAVEIDGDVAAPAMVMVDSDKLQSSVESKVVPAAPVLGSEVAAEVADTTEVAAATDIRTSGEAADATAPVKVAEATALAEAADLPKWSLLFNSVADVTAADRAAYEARLKRLAVVNALLRERKWFADREKYLQIANGIIALHLFMLVFMFMTGWWYTG